MTKVKFIAEIGSNHNRSWDRTKELIHTAKQCRFDAVKFQLFDAEKLWREKTKSKTMKNWELPIEFIPTIQKECINLDMEFGCTPFYLKAVDILNPYVDFFKIGSFELLWKELIEKCIETGKQLFISTGMSTEKEKFDAYNNDLCVVAKQVIEMYCCSEYPAPIKKCNLNSLAIAYNNDFNVGWSDHTVEPGVIYKVIGLGAKHIEMHFDLEDMLGREASIGHCWSPYKAEKVICDVRIGEQAMYGKESFKNIKYKTDPKTGMRGV